MQNLGLDRDPDSSKSMDPNRDTMNCDPGSHCSYEQCCETVMIYRGWYRLWKSFGSGSVSRQYLAGFQQQFFLQNLAFSMLETALFLESRPLLFDFFTYRYVPVFCFMLNPDPNPVREPDPERIPLPIRLRQKVAVTVPQHYL